jgi:hypothetical protein
MPIFSPIFWRTYSKNHNIDTWSPRSFHRMLNQTQPRLTKVWCRKKCKFFAKERVQTRETISLFFDTSFFAQKFFFETEVFFRQKFKIRFPLGLFLNRVARWVCERIARNVANFLPKWKRNFFLEINLPKIWAPSVVF